MRLCAGYFITIIDLWSIHDRVKLIVLCKRQFFSKFIFFYLVGKAQLGNFQCYSIRKCCFEFFINCGLAVGQLWAAAVDAIIRNYILHLIIESFGPDHSLALI